ncbi:MAG: hypothetical protein LBU89_10295 [Fibromonadaceae bacterium]|jgi:hypothetical protein|nr:hypothetical protein [Fibromonadaceae bacterium]
MRPQYFPWLFDDKEAWEKVISSPQFSYELPMDYFMSIYQVERKMEGIGAYALPSFSAPIMSMPAVTMPVAVAPVVAAPVAVGAAPAAAPEKEASNDGILSQDEIDALLSGL